MVSGYLYVHAVVWRQEEDSEVTLEITEYAPNNVPRR